MSFSSSVKEELLKLKIESSLENQAELYSLLIFSKNEIKNNNILLCDNLYVMRRISTLVYGDENHFKISPKYSIQLPDNLKKLSLQEFSANFFINFVFEDVVPQLLRGAFLAAGSVTNPEFSYHLEIFAKNSSLVEIFNSIIGKTKIINLKVGMVKKKSGYSLYIKDNKQITDFLTYIGATNSSMEFMQVKMVKEVRNYINRTTNFETANITKTTSAATVQINAIRNIINTVGLDALPKPLRETAILRLENPYMTLDELSTLFSKPISRSGVNYRLKQILNYLN